MRLLSFNTCLLATALFLLSACTASRYYTPNTMQIPMLTDKGQGTVSLGATVGSRNSGWEAQAVYSPLPHLGIMVNHFNLHYNGLYYRDNTGTPFPTFSYTSEYDGSTRLTEGALGGYWQTGPQQEYLVSLYAGWGQGRTENKYLPPAEFPTEEIYYSSWNNRRWFVQPALGMQYGRFQVGTAFRFVWVDYYNGDINSRVGLQETERIELLEKNTPLFLTELGWTIGWHLRPVVISLNSSAVVRGKNSVRELDLASNHVSLTVGLNLHELTSNK